MTGPNRKVWKSDTFQSQPPKLSCPPRASLFLPLRPSACAQRVFDASILSDSARRVVDGRRRTWRTSETPSPADFSQFLRDQVSPCSRGGAGRSRGVLVRFPHRCAALRAALHAAHTALRAPKRGAWRSPEESAPLRVSKRCRSSVLLCALRAAERFSAMRARCSACCARTSDCDR